MKNDAAVISQQNMPELYACHVAFEQLTGKIDRLEEFVAVVTSTLTTLENQVQLAEEDLGVNAVGLKGLFKPLLSGIAKKRTENVNSISTTTDPVRPLLTYAAPEIFRSDDYFTGNLVSSNVED